MRGATFSVLVVDRQSGQTVFAREPDRRLVPASNQKVLTAAAALAHFGPAHRFVTAVEAARRPDDAGRVAWLGVRGSGDPSLTSEQWWRLAADLRALGVREVTGPLWVDDRAFDDERWHPSWQPVTARAYHGPVGALTANYGAFRVHVSPGAAPGSPARVQVDPPVPYFEVANRATTAPAGTRPSLQVDRLALGAQEQVKVAGRVPVGREGRDVYRSVAHPTRYAAAVLRMQLEAVGITVRGETRRGPLPEGGVELLAFEGHPLAHVVELFMKNSNNMMGESLVKGLGRREDRPGSWPTGLEAMRDVLGSLGIDLSQTTLADGSGLSRDNRVSARTLVSVLQAADRAFTWSPEFFASLPLAGQDGTLKKRAGASQDQARAKTGLLTGVTGLTGLAQRADGQEVFFSVLANDYRLDAGSAMGQIDAFLAALTGGVTAQPSGESPSR